MRFAGGNRAVRDHAQNSEDLYLFEKAPPAHLRYVGQFVCSAYQLVDGVPDADGKPRTAIAFELAPLEADQSDDDRAEADVSGLSLEQLREAALQPPPAAAGPAKGKRNAYFRSAAVRAYTLARANGTCEGCHEAAPFQTKASRTKPPRPYLEPHHTRRLSDGGPDHPAAVIALCPTCHRRAHYADDGPAFNAGLIGHMLELEGSVSGDGSAS